MQAVKRKTHLSVDGLLVIVGGGEVDLALILHLHKRGATLIAADGGVNILAGLDIIPTAIIGDMDSLENREDWAQKTKVLEIFEQETTDFEKCLYSVEAPITIALGMSGKRLDHTLAALDVLVRYSVDRALAIVSETDLVLAVRGKFKFEVDPGARVSVHPVMPIKFAGSKGLEYGLAGIELMPGKQTGTSNCAVSKTFEIEPLKNQDAPYLLIIEKKYLNDWLNGPQS